MTEWKGRPYTAVVSVERLDIDLGYDVITFRELLEHGITNKIVELCVEPVEAQ